ncbi:MAG: hypothetical protein HFJ20_05830 [Clostridia bacterium]|nr:hypothetical protein [Clostridia bacterium]
MKKCSIALSGGGAKVIQFTELIRVLEEMEIEVTAVSGISSGSFIAILIAAGYNGKEASDLLKKHYKSFNELHFHPRWKNSYGIFSNDHIRDVINTVCMQKKIFTMSDFKLPIQLVAYDVYANRKVYFTNEPIEGEYCITLCTPGDAVAATSALPIIYNGKTIIDDEGNKILCSDGGARGNYAVDSLKRYNSEIVACGYDVPEPEVKGFVSIGRTMFMGCRWILSEQERLKADYSLLIKNPNAKVLDRGGKHLDEYVSTGKEQIETFFSKIL